MTGPLLIEHQDGVDRVTLNRPEARNAMTFAMYDQLVEICDAVENDPDIRVLVLTGAGGKAFVAGTDISQFQTFTDPEQAIEYEARVERVVARLETLERPTIAAIQGVAVGGGATMSLVCDLRLCTPDSRFGVPIARTLGNCLAPGGLARLIDLIGPMRTKELIFTAKLVDAPDALAAGLINEVVESERLEERVTELAELIAGRDVFAVAAPSAAGAALLTALINRGALAFAEAD